LSGWIADQQRRLLDQIDHHLTDLSDAPTPQREWLWSDEALGVDPRWIEVRRIAADLLTTLRSK
jgi:hypothetical protein